MYIDSPAAPLVVVNSYHLHINPPNPVMALNYAAVWSLQHICLHPAVPELSIHEVHKSSATTEHCPNLVQSDANTPPRRGGDTLAASQVQPEHCPNLNVFILKFWLCSFDDMFWSWCSLCPQNCNSTANAPAKRGWGHLGCNLNVT